MPSDQLVTHEHILKATMELERRGSTNVGTELEKLEPDLTEFILESLTRLYHQLMDKGLSGNDARKLHARARKIVLVSIMALRQAQRQLWDQNPLPPDPPADPPS